jgi:hypothetical protein
MISVARNYGAVIVYGTGLQEGSGGYVRIRRLGRKSEKGDAGCAENRL